MSTEGVDNNHEEVKNKREAEEKGNKRVPFLKLFTFADGWDCILMVIGSVAACLHGASVPVLFVFFGRVLNDAGEAYLDPSSVPHRVAKSALAFVYLSIVMLFSAWMEVACWMHTGERQATKMRLAYLHSVLYQDIALFDTETSTGEVIAAVTSEIIVVQDAISEKVGNFIHYVSRFIAGFVIGFAKIWQISLVTLSIVPLIAVAGGIYAYIASGLMAKVQKSYVKAGEVAEEVIGNVRTVQAFVGEEKAVESYKNALVKTYAYGKKGGLAKGLGLGSVYCVLFFSWAMLMWFTGIIVHKGIANGGDAFSTMINVVVAGLSLGQAAPNISSFLRARVAAYPIFKMLGKNQTNKAKAKTGKTLSRVEGHIQFSNVRFSYPSRPDVLIFDGLNLDIPSAKIIAIVGGSGSGKSTVISLIERFYEPLSGAILLDQCDIKELELKWLRQQIGLVNQEPVLFSTSIWENMLYGKEGATTDEVTHAAKLSEAFSFINNLPDRYETQVGERGIQLSGGQKQRIAIARVILKDPKILLLDEATSSLDAESEKSVQEALDRVMVGRTTVVVAHRLSTIRNADMIVVVQDGKIVETGTHDELMQDPQSAYASLIQLQQSASQQRSPHSEGATMGLNPRISSSRELSGRMSSFRLSFRSDKEGSKYVAEVDEPTKPTLASMRRLYSLASPDWTFGMLGTIGAFATGAQTPLLALGITQALVSYYMDWDTTQKEIRKLGLLFCGAAILSVVSYTVEHLNFSIVGERLTLCIRERTFRAILQNEIGWFDDLNNASSMLTSVLETNATVLRTVVVDVSLTILQNIGMVITALITSFILNWRLSLVILATTPLMVIGSISEHIFMSGFGGNLSKAYLRANMLAAEAVSNIRTVAAFCSEEKIINFYRSELEAPAKRSFCRGQIAGILYGIFQCCLYSSVGLVLWYGSVLMSRNLASFSGIVKPVMVLSATAVGMGQTLAALPDITKGSQMAASVFEMMDRKTEVDGDVGEDVERVEGVIEMNRVEFRYPSRPEVAIFRDFNLRVKAGKSMALVGTSGSGKSSVLSLIVRFYDPTSGRVMIDGKDIKKLKLKSLRKHISLVQQEPALFATTIYDNILYGKDGATEAEVIEAAKVANADSFISALPQGYSTKVGERGTQLSGGQKQRIAIARAVIRNPAILLLDEATSALDAESENVVQQALDRIMKTRTTVMVAHRLSTIRNADIISVLEDGKIIEQGNHSSLVENKNGAYYKLINLQQKQH